MAKRTDSFRLRVLTETLRQGGRPRLHTYLPGAGAVVESFGLVPNVDIFIPDLNYDILSLDERRMVRQRFRDLKRYRQQQLAVGIKSLACKTGRRKAADAVLQDLNIDIGDK